MAGRVVVFCLLLVTALAANAITVPNGDFSSTTNANAASPVGGGLLTPSASNVALGSTGPWVGSYTGALGVLAPPTLAIDSSTHLATIGGIAGLNVAGALVANSGAFSQVLPSSDPAAFYKANKTYSLSVNVDAPTVVGASLLNNAIASAALTATSGASTTTVAHSDVNPATLTLLATNHYLLTMPYTTPASGGAIGSQIGISLYSHPQGLVSLTLLSQISFSNVALARFGTIPSAISVTIGSQSGTQTAVVGQPYAHPLSVTVVDADGDPVPGVPVTFAAPTSGAGATLSPTGTITTGPDGTAVVNATANTLPGSYPITATVGGVTTPATFNLTNVAGPPAFVIVLPPPPTSATVGTTFAPLNVLVTDQYGNAVADGTPLTVSTVAAVNGAGTQAASISTTTTAGVAQITETANNIAGSYSLYAVAGSITSAPIPVSNAPGVPIKVKPGVGGNATASGTPQSATVTKHFAVPLSVLVTDEFDNPIPGIAVSFTMPSSGPSAILSANPATTGPDGVATITATANNLIGSYQITAMVVNGTQTTVFTLTNTGAVTHPAGGTPQVSVVSGEFGCALIAQVTDSNGPVVGVNVQFIATPAASGASATLSSLSGSENTNPLSVATDSSGGAAVVATGNATAGTYTVSAGIPGTGQTVSYVLTNLAVGERLFANGFEDPLNSCPVATPQ